MQRTSVSDTRAYFDRLYARRRQRKAGEITAAHYDNNPAWQHYTRAHRRWVEDMRLEGKRVLEVGCGLGLLQDVVGDYVGIDIARSSGAYLRKPFMTASATALPFADNSFDGVWSIWVLEHIPQPEQMLREIERVLKPGGALFLCAAWEVQPWVAKGYDVRPYHDLSWRERAIKATVMPRTALAYRQAATLLKRVWRLATAGRSGGAPLDYRTLEPNFETYWSADADACTTVDSQAVWLWYTRRGHRSLDAGSALASLALRHTEPLRFRMAGGADE